MTIIKRSIAVMLFVGLFTFGGSKAEAQTYYTSSQASQIATLQALIAQLQAQLALMNGGQTYYQPSTPAYSYGNGDVTVTTGAVNNNTYGNVSFTGTARFSRSNAAKVWFEYGPTAYLTYSTPAADVNQYSGTKTFTMFADAVLPGTLTYYRAAASDNYGRVSYGETRSFVANGYNSYYSYNNNNSYHYTSNSRNFDRPTVTTDREDQVTYSRARLNGRIDMNDARRGKAFFVYGEDRNRVSRASSQTSYEKVTTYGSDLKKVLVDSSFDGNDDVVSTVTGLHDDTDIYFRLCVSYENDDTNDNELTCGNIRQFTTDNY
jgi:hypothetical protein